MNRRLSSPFYTLVESSIYDGTDDSAHGTASAFVIERDPIRDAIPHSLPDTRTQLNSYGQIVCPVLHTSSRLCSSGAESQRNSPCDYVNQDRRQGTVEPASARHSAVGCGRTRPERLTRSFCWGSVGIGTKTPADPSAPPDGLGPAFRPLLHVSNFQGMHEN